MGVSLFLDSSKEDPASYLSAYLLFPPHGLFCLCTLLDIPPTRFKSPPKVIVSSFIQLVSSSHFWATYYHLLLHCTYGNMALVFSYPFLATYVSTGLCSVHDQILVSREHWGLSVSLKWVKELEKEKSDKLSAFQTQRTGLALSSISSCSGGDILYLCLFIWWVVTKEKEFMKHLRCG